MQLVSKELQTAWQMLSASIPSLQPSPYPKLFINASNQKAYFAFYPTSPASSLSVKIRWFEKSRCGCCIDCCIDGQDDDHHDYSHVFDNFLCSYKLNK